jgi:hypothetical protein
VNVHPRTGSQASTVQAFVSWHRLAGAELCWHPTVGEHESAVQASWSLQSRGVAPAQVPAWQASPTMHAFPSLHAEPSGSAVNVHPRAGSHASAVQGFVS